MTNTGEQTGNQSEFACPISERKSGFVTVFHKQAKEELQNQIQSLNRIASSSE